MIGRKPVIINVTQPAHTEYVTRTVHEHRAPTDESVKLLREMEQAAQAKIDQSIRLGFPDFSVDVMVFMLYSLGVLTSEHRVEGSTNERAALVSDQGRRPLVP